MPLWLIFHPPTTFKEESTKQALAKRITDVYTFFGLPAFYVNVLYIPVEPSSYYIGGVARPSAQSTGNEPGPDSTKPWIRISIENIARKIPNAESRDRFLGKVDEALKPFIEDMGYDWEYSINETDRDLWKIQGLVPPMPKSEAEGEWVRGNRPVPYIPEKGGLL